MSDEELMDFPPLHNHIGDGKWHVDCDACNNEPASETQDGSPMGMAGQPVEFPTITKMVCLPREDCPNVTPHLSHIWPSEGEDGTINVVCMGIDINGNRKGILFSLFTEEDPRPDPDVKTTGVHVGKEDLRCPTCESPDPRQHPAVSGGGEVTHICPDPFHGENPRPNPDLLKDYPETSKAVQRWADSAMFKAEPMDATAGPKVYLLWMTPDPLGAIAAACKMYKGEVVRDLSTVTDAERLEYFEQVQKTKLKAPFEFVKFHFMIEGVTRAFTHQMVRQRTAAYAQESLRFAVKEDMPVALPPFISGVGDDWGYEGQSREAQMREIWEETTDAIQARYDKLIELGMPAEDARGLLPHNVLTRLHYTTDLRALLDHAGNRLCTQAQFEWRLVFAKIIEAIRNISCGKDHGWIKGVPRAMINVNGMDSAWMARTLLDAFKPVCFQTGKCEFKANFDRHCNIRERVDQNESIGRPSSEWDKHHDDPTGIGGNVLRIAPIKPGEWLLDPGAARKKD